jgi:CheY-like chemotaxis protein
MSAVPKVLIVEDETLIADYFKIMIEHLGYEVCGIAGTADMAVRLARQENPSIIFMDVRVDGERDGVDAALEICAHRPVPIVYVTASEEPQTLERILSDHPTEILIKPVLEKDIGAALARHCPLPG